MDKFYLLPGKVFADRSPHVVDTVLGSCVAVVLWDPVLRFGGINHFMLPKLTGNGILSDKYGDIAMQNLIQKMLRLGSYKTNLKAKVFGGSIRHDANGIFQIGQRNAEFAFDILDVEKIPVVSQSVGGCLGRKLIFYSENGDVMLKFMKPADAIAPAPNKLKY
ncbi:chemotaxis protein CheD [Mucilaginibacter sp. Bleaf8]|uniref:chemotaxis protein CheD n=1 Tax=Mucilaginibacter sp. Bleaf8 TaxID=2834430 RepID=UPI001BCCF443|nr:chemotaxis protein CheD [Mucilaginibacter sp. Bleaf8]MBS7566785.1 chemotaxis protein CheD [Mucilaginibacter sp. Bleaf8]